MSHYIDIKNREYNNTKFLKLNALESFYNAPNKQTCCGLEMIIEEPYATIKFDKNKSLIAITWAVFKSKEGYHNKNHSIIYINNTIIKIGEDINIEDYKNIIKEKNNELQIKFIVMENWEYFKHICVFPDDEIDEFDKWKN